MFFEGGSLSEAASQELRERLQAQAPPKKRRLPKRAREATPEEVDEESSESSFGVTALPPKPAEATTAEWETWVKSRRAAESQRVKEERCLCGNQHLWQEGWWAACDICLGWARAGCGGLSKTTHEAALDAGSHWMCEKCQNNWQRKGHGCSSTGLF